MGSTIYVLTLTLKESELCFLCGVTNYNYNHLLCHLCSVTNSDLRHVCRVKGCASRFCNLRCVSIFCHICSVINWACNDVFIMSLTLGCDILVVHLTIGSVICLVSLVASYATF